MTRKLCSLAGRRSSANQSKNCNAVATHEPANLEWGNNIYSVRESEVRSVLFVPLMVITVVPVATTVLCGTPLTSEVDPQVSKTMKESCADKPSPMMPSMLQERPLTQVRS